MFRLIPMVLASAFLAATLPVLSAQAEVPEFKLSIKDNRFDPQTVEIPAGQKVKLVVRNLDASPEEFESAELRREKVIAGNSEGVIFIGPLSAGSYEFIGEFHPESAKGRIIVK